MWFKESNSYFCKIENFTYGEISERGFSNPHPGFISRWYNLKEGIIRDLITRHRFDDHRFASPVILRYCRAAKAIDATGCSVCLPLLCHWKRQFAPYLVKFAPYLVIYHSLKALKRDLSANDRNMSPHLCVQSDTSFNKCLEVWRQMSSSNDFFVRAKLGWGVLKPPFVNYSLSKIFDFAKVTVRFFESHSYLTGITRAELWRYLSNMIFNI